MTALKYIGGGTYIHGVPARDLTEDEAAQFGPVIQQQQEAAHVQMYEPVTQAAQTVSKRAAKADAEEGGNG